MYITDAILYDEFNPMAHVEVLRCWSLDFPKQDRPRILKTTDFDTPLNESTYVWKFVVEGDLASLSDFASEPLIIRHFVAEQSFPNRFDYAKIGNPKGNRLAEYIQTIGIKPEQVVAIGDNHNDISMINLAGMGVTLSHADEIVKTAANVTLPICNDDEQGLANFIKSIFDPVLST
jgi:hydroxymethylpyrimidine pyrophosphatase-like HAD family hydrolase